MRRLAPALLLALAVAAGAPPALAHASLESASPKDGARLAAAPSEVQLTFSEKIEPAFSKVQVIGPPGFGGAAPASAAGDHRTLTVALKRPLPAGRYEVRWRVLSADSHRTQGAFHFEVGR
jgi:methionine-rich copper-binding protein CopC